MGDRPPLFLRSAAKGRRYLGFQAHHQAFGSVHGRSVDRMTSAVNTHYVVDKRSVAAQRPVVQRWTVSLSLGTQTTWSSRRETPAPFRHLEAQARVVRLCRVESNPALDRQQQPASSLGAGERRA